MGVQLAEHAPDGEAGKPAEIRHPSLTPPSLATVPDSRPDTSPDVEMKTTHQMARELLALPDVPLYIDEWFYHWGDREIVAEMTNNPEGTALIWQKPVNQNEKRPGGETGARCVGR